MEFSHPWNNPIPIPFLPRNPALTSVRVAADSFSSSPFAASQCSAIEVKSYKRSKRTGRHARETEWGTVFVGRNKPALFQPDPNIEMGVDPERTPELKRNLKTRGGGEKNGTTRTTLDSSGLVALSFSLCVDSTSTRSSFPASFLSILISK